MKIDINGQSLTLKFGFGFLRKLGEKHGLSGYAEVGEMVQNAFSNMDKMTFEQEDVLFDIIYCAAENFECLTKEQEEAFKGFSVVDFVINNEAEMHKITKALEESFPKGEGKQKAQRNMRKK